MKNLLLTITIGLLIASCSTGTQPDQQKSNLVKTKIGAWTSVYNPDAPKDSHLNWDGKSTSHRFARSEAPVGKSDSTKWGYYDSERIWHPDTVTYNNTSQHISMQAKMLNYDGYGDLIPVLIYTDSTLTESVRNQIVPFNPNIIHETYGVSEDFKHAVTADQDNPDYTLFRLPYKACGDSLKLTNGSDYITIVLTRLDGENYDPDIYDPFEFNAFFVKLYVGEKANKAIQDMCANVVK